MKPFTALLFLLLCTCVPAVTRAQSDYQLFRPGVQYLYANPDFDDPTYQIASAYYGVRVDSLGCTDLYGSLETFFGADRSCVYKVPSPFGYGICQYADSTMMRFDTGYRVVLYPRAAVGERWLAAGYAADSVYAEVVADESGQVLGQTDSLKTIAFSRPDGEPIGVPIVVGRRLGLVSGTRLYRIGGETAALPLAGLSAPLAGLQLPPAAAYVRAAVGDTFQVASSNYGLEPPIGGGPFQQRFASVVIEAIDSTDPASYIYQMRGDIYEPRDPAPGASEPRYAVLALDTVFTYTAPRPPAFLTGRQPGARVDTLYGQPGVAALIKLYRDSCGLLRTRLSTPITYEGTAGCGFNQSEVDGGPGDVYVACVPFPLDSINTQGGPRAVRLQYLGAADRQCGRYLDADDILLPTRSFFGATSVAVEVYPNPATDHLNVRLPAGKGGYDLSLMSTMGQQLRSATSVAGEYTFDLGALPAGPYLLLVAQNGVPLAATRFLIQ